MAPEYLICLECQDPCYTFEWDDGRVTEVKCSSCGNDDPRKFKSAGDWGDRGRVLTQPPFVVT